MSRLPEAESRPSLPETPLGRAEAFLNIWTGVHVIPPELRKLRNPVDYLSRAMNDPEEWKRVINNILTSAEMVQKGIDPLLERSPLSPHAQSYLKRVSQRHLLMPLNFAVPRQVLGFDEEHPLGFFDEDQSWLVECRLFQLSKYVDVEDKEYRTVLRQEDWDRMYRDWEVRIIGQTAREVVRNQSTQNIVYSALMGNPHPDLLLPIEELKLPLLTKFYKLGGTWDMVERDGKLIGTGNLDDQELAGIEQSLGIDGKTPVSRLVRAERRLAQLLHQRMKNTRAESFTVDEHFKSWCPVFAEQTTGPFVALYSGDSSHLRASLVAPIVSIIIEEAIKDPQTPIIGAQGTDTADIAVLSILDALVFDTKLPPFIFTGANRSHREENSDAANNFNDLALLTAFDIRYLNSLPVGEYDYKHHDANSGAFWMFHDNIYTAADLNKLDPGETREIEGESTFFSPHNLAINIRILGEVGTFWGKFLRTNWTHNTEAPPEGHISRRFTMEQLFEALNSVETVSLEDQNRIWRDVAAIRDSRTKAVIIAAHGLGNVNNVIRQAAVEAAKEGRIVIDVSRSLIGEVNTRYAGSLLDANNGELADSNTRILTSNKLNKTAARSVAVRAILEGLDQQKTQDLIDSYSKARKLL